MGDAVAIGHCVKICTQSNAFQNHRCVLAGGANSQHKASGPQLIQGIFYFIGQVGGGHLVQQIPVDLIFLSSQLLLVLLRQSRPLVTFQDNLQASHPRHASEPVIDLPVKVSVDTVCHLFPS